MYLLRERMTAVSAGLKPRGPHGKARCRSAPETGRGPGALHVAEGERGLLNEQFGGRSQFYISRRSVEQLNPDVPFEPRHPSGEGRRRNTQLLRGPDKLPSRAMMTIRMLTSSGFLLCMGTCLYGCAAFARRHSERPRQFRDGLGFRASFWEEVQQLRENFYRRLKSGSDKPGDVHLATMEVTKY